MPTDEQYLIIHSDGSCRVTRTLRNLTANEVAYKLNITIPDTWGSVVGEIDVNLPEPPNATLVDDMLRVKDELDEDE